MSSLSLNDITTASNIEVRKNSEPENHATESETKPGPERPKSKFTRGEKCLFVHLVVTFCLILLVAIIYCVHLFVVNHDADSYFSADLRNRPDTINVEQADYLPVGLVHVLPDSYMCNSMLLNENWSLAPAHCVTARSDPDLAYALLDWRIVYGNNNGHKADKTDNYIKTQIKRSIPHPHFNSDDFHNNLGLFEHDNPVKLVSYADLDQALSDEILKENENDLQLIGWEDSWPQHVEQADYLPVGLVHVLPDSYMCNSMLLNENWSLAPAHCVTARSDPDLAYALLDWRIVYGNNNGHKADKTDNYIKTQIKRSIPHPHFNSDDFHNNLGLFEHDNPVKLVSYADLDQALSDEILKENENDLQLIGWEDSWPQHGHLVNYPVQPFVLENCKMYVSPILELRAYEQCVTLQMKQNVSIIPGAVLAMKSKFVGFFSWGESRGKALPFVILDLAHFNDWIRHIVTMT